MTLPDTDHRPGYQFVYREYAQALYDALVEDAFYITMEQQLGEQREAREAMLRYLDYSMVEARDYGTLYFPETHRHGVAVWSQPLAPARETQRKSAKLEFLRSHMGTASATRYQGIADFMSRQSAALVDASAWYLSIVGVLPAWQNRGLGGALIAPVLEQADRAGVPTFLETFTPRNEPFYQRLGYRVAGTFFEPTIGAHYSLMLRE
ncbi:MAG: GNAT family N-acetyltransferase [Gammaproteobacteria bacterium]|jgi:GNAT superfamily N-acetyltransferase|nr:GNAT family N-acetyltransferase [Gammaproteobacteria bacterium]